MEANIFLHGRGGIWILWNVEKSPKRRKFVPKIPRNQPKKIEAGSHFLQHSYYILRGYFQNDWYHTKILVTYLPKFLISRGCDAKLTKQKKKCYASPMANDSMLMLCWGVYLNEYLFELMLFLNKIIISSRKSVVK